MDIPALSMNISQSQLQTDVGTAVLSQVMNSSADMSDGLSKMMEQSVNPYIGSNLDISL